VQFLIRYLFLFRIPLISRKNFNYLENQSRLFFTKNKKPMFYTNGCSAFPGKKTDEGGNIFELQYFNCGITYKNTVHFDTVVLYNYQLMTRHE
jgi:hypothetical protein